MSPVSRSQLVPAVFTAVVTLVCLALGFWQLERLEWKTDLIAERRAAVQSAPVPVPQTLEEARRLEFHPVIAEGVFLHDKEVYLGAASPSRGPSGFHVLTPLRLGDGRIVFINRGFVPSQMKDPETRAAGQLAGPVRVAGPLRLPKGRPGWLVPDNRPDMNYWFWVDLPAMAAATGLPDVAPFYIDADATPNPDGWPKGGVTPIDLPNDHLNYAITWFALAAAAIAVYIAWRRQAGTPRRD
ncbi:MAG: SURF1 family protein [Alphaproteobacteria bacterium]